VDVESSLDLPVAMVQDSLLGVKAAGPQNVTSGTSFPFTLQVGDACLQHHVAGASLFSIL
jgi:hypothetical protein